MDPISITAAAVAFIQSVSAIYKTIENLKGVPNAFKEVGQNLGLVKETLELAGTQLQETTVNESTKKAIADVVVGCKKKAEKLDTIFKEIDKGKKNDENAKDWSALVNVYRAAVLRLGKPSRVENLMQGILSRLNLLATHQAFRKEGKKLENAIEKLSRVEPSLQDWELDQSGVRFSQEIAEGGTGNQFSTQSGTMKNHFGHEFHSQAGMNFETIHLHSTFTGLYCAKWLKASSPPLSFEQKQLVTNQITVTVPRTGKWFLDSQNFTQWREGKFRKLWCPGIHGAGKTVLTSIVIRHLQTHFAEYKQVTCIYFYFEHKERKIQVLKPIFSTLLIQLLRDDIDVSAEIKRRCKNKQEFCDMSDILEMLTSQLKQFHRVLMVIDALDECADANGFLKACEKLPEEVHMLFTSRPDRTLARAFNADREYEISPNDDDMREYLKFSFRENHKLQKMVDREQRNDPTFQDRVLDTIVEKSRGMQVLLIQDIETC
ncbi:hypothetical protein EV356DRAFT_537864 [Viridothelium virens]|uniref:NACHT domain-containing protein n=1 Tax=Viridothelium virens TaxID=1048519 RepID=A0A6A6GT17_VIRVR|nr:hypothetical protein EV356DRAFT_537864 [Viridothelium virens]